MSRIKSIQAIEILDSRGFPTLLVKVTTEQGIVGKAKVPSGASTGEREALELRDKEKDRYFGKGVKKAVSHVNQEIASLLKGKDVCDQVELDTLMIEADGTEGKKRFGANSILGVSLASARAAAYTLNIPLYHYIGGCSTTILPCPMMNILNGGMHADNGLEFQEFMIRPIGAPSFSEALRWGVEIFHTLKTLLKEEGHVISVGDEGGFAPQLASNEAAIEFLLKAIEKTGFKPKKEVSIALDCAASEFFDKSSKSYIERKKKEAKQPFASRSSEEQIDYLISLCKDYPIDSIEDGLDQNDWEGWTLFMEKMGHKIQIVGDDLFVTNAVFLQRAIDRKVANAILIKLNQIGTLTETLRTIELAKRNGFNVIPSHRSGETEDPFIADLAVGVNAGQIKTGSLCRSERTAKYNRLLEIEADLGPSALFYQAI